jgi:hypothetical protein
LRSATEFANFAGLFSGTVPTTHLAGAGCLEEGEAFFRSLLGVAPLDMSNTEHPFLILTAICDASARPAAITVGHGDAMERAFQASQGLETGGLDLVELPIAPAAFAALRKYLQIEDGRVTVYDLFPLSAQLDPRYRGIAGQFLAAEALWALEEQGMLSGVPFTVQFDLPRGWDKDPKKLHERLVSEKALELNDSSIDTFKRVKARWDASHTS